MSATYGELIGQASADVHAGMISSLRDHFVDDVEARNVIGAYYDVLHALRRHTWTLVDPQMKHPSALMSATGKLRETPESVAVRIFTTIPQLSPRRPTTPFSDPGFTHPLASAALRLGAASDLLATHIGRGYTPRSEHAPLVMDPLARVEALRPVMHMANAVLSSELGFGLKAGQVGVPWDTVQRWLPGVKEPLAMAGELDRVLPPEGTAPELRDVPINYHAIRLEDPFDELADRLARLRHASWAMSTDPDFSVATLRDLAQLGVAVHAHTAVLHGLDLHAAAATRSTDPVIAGARAWQRLGADLHDYLAPGPANPQIRTDVLSLRQLLHQLLPISKTYRLGQVAGPATRRFGAVMNQAMASMTQIAHWNATEFRTLAHSGHIHIHAAHLSGEHVSYSTDLAAAKLAGARVVVPFGRAKDTLDHYKRITGAATIATPTPAPAPARQPARDHARTIPELVISRPNPE